ncbi:hypothetical protein AAZX31_08G025200 [Glycine max]
MTPQLKTFTSYHSLYVQQIGEARNEHESIITGHKAEQGINRSSNSFTYFM